MERESAKKEESRLQYSTVQLRSLEIRIFRILQNKGKCKKWLERFDLSAVATIYCTFYLFICLAAFVVCFSFFILLAL